MDYFPHFLLAATLLTGIIWCIDRFVWRPRRQAAAEELERATPVGDRLSDNFLHAREEVLREPALMEWAGSFFPVLAVILVLRSFVVEPFVIPSGSMIPTLEIGDYILVNKYAYGLRLPVFGTKIVDIGAPERGDVMVFFPPHEDTYYIKRVIGVPGDRIAWINKRLVINGEPVPTQLLDRQPARRPVLEVYEESLGSVTHLIHLIPPRGDRDDEWVVGEGEYFMMGDNRDMSNDSRSWGPAAEHRIVGKAFAIWAHKEPGWHLPSFARNRIIE